MSGQLEPRAGAIVACADNPRLRAAFSAPFFAHFFKESMAQYVFSMNRVTKTVPPKRQILKDISLSFFPGAKIGVLA